MDNHPSDITSNYIKIKASFVQYTSMRKLNLKAIFFCLWGVGWCVGKEKSTSCMFISLLKIFIYYIIAKWTSFYHPFFPSFIFLRNNRKKMQFNTKIAFFSSSSCFFFARQRGKFPPIKFRLKMSLRIFIACNIQSKHQTEFFISQSFSFYFTRSLTHSALCVLFLLNYFSLSHSLLFTLYLTHSFKGTLQHLRHFQITDRWHDGIFSLYELRL